jgi:hypothetical protein
MPFAALALAVTTVAGLATARVDAVAVPKSATAIRAGGDLSDDFWQTVAPNDAFVQREPEEGGVPSQRTEFRVAYDATTLFVKVRAFDTDAGKIVSYLTRRDGDSPSDWIRVLIDSYHDKRTAYEFGVNPAGVKFDRYWYNDNNSDDSWDAIWDVKVSRDAAGWTADFPDPTNFFDPRFHSQAITPTGSTNDSFYASSQLDTLLDAARQELEPSKRAAIYRRAERILYDDAPWIWDYHRVTIEVTQPYVRNFELHPIWLRDYTSAWLDLGPDGRPVTR